MKKISLCLSVLLLVIGSTNAFGQKASFQTINIMDDFWKFWEKAEPADVPTRTKLFREMVIAPHREIFEAFTCKCTDEQFAPYFKVLPKWIPKFKRMSRELNQKLPRQVAAFKKTFPDMSWSGTVVFMPTFGSLDSGGGELNGKSFLIFGVDTIAFDYAQDADLNVLFSHELFHLYHGQFHLENSGGNREKGQIPLYQQVWNEGLATYASSRLNPGATLDQIFLTPTTVKESAPILPKLAKTVLINFDSGSPDVWKPFMASEKMSDEIPPRSGYYVGYKIAEELGKKTSLRKLAQLKGEELKMSMKAVLKELEK